MVTGAEALLYLSSGSYLVGFTIWHLARFTIWQDSHLVGDRSSSLPKLRVLCTPSSEWSVDFRHSSGLRRALEVEKRPVSAQNCRLNPRFPG